MVATCLNSVHLHLHLLYGAFTYNQGNSVPPSLSTIYICIYIYVFIYSTASIKEWKCCVGLIYHAAPNAGKMKQRILYGVLQHQGGRILVVKLYYITFLLSVALTRH